MLGDVEDDINTSNFNVKPSNKPDSGSDDAALGSSGPHLTLDTEQFEDTFGACSFKTVSINISGFQWD